MIGKGTLVEYTGEPCKDMWPGRRLMVHERDGEKIIVWNEQKSNTEYSQKTISVKDVREIC